MKYRNKNVTVVRDAREGDPNYVTNKPGQVVVKYEDGQTETVTRTDLSDGNAPGGSVSTPLQVAANEEIAKKRQQELEIKARQEDRARKRQRDLDIESSHVLSPLPKAIRDLQEAKDNLARAKLTEKFLPAETERVELELKQKQKSLENTKNSVATAEKVVVDAQKRVDELTNKQQEEAKRLEDQKAVKKPA